MIIPREIEGRIMLMIVEDGLSIATMPFFALKVRADIMFMINMIE